MENKVSSRQVVGLIFLLTCLTKFLSLPSMLAQVAGKNAYFSVILLFLLDFLVLFALLWMIKVANTQNFYQFVVKLFSKTIAKIICFLYAVYFFAKVFLVIIDSNNFLSYSFYSNFSPFVFVIVLGFLLFFIATKPSRAIFRAYEILRLPIFLSIIIAVLTSTLSAKPHLVLPILEGGAVPVLSAGFKQVFWFGDLVFLFLVFGKIKTGEALFKHSFISFALASVAVVVFVFNFYTIFQSLATYQQVAISDTLGALSSQNALSHAYWLIDVMWSVALIYGVAILFYASVGFLKKSTKIKKTTGSLILLIALFIMLIILQFDIDNLLLVSSPYWSVFAILMQYILPFVLFIVLKFKKGDFLNEK